jgi:hypothetical protein
VVGRFANPEIPFGTAPSIFVMQAFEAVHHWDFFANREINQGDQGRHVDSIHRPSIFFLKISIQLLYLFRAVGRT